MRLISLLVTLTVACWALPAHADMASYEREQKAKRARIAELDRMLKDAMEATPTTFDDATKLHASTLKMEKATATVRAELSTGKLRVPGPTYGQLQDSLGKLVARVDAMKAAERAAKALDRLEPIAAAHGVPAAADLDEAARLVLALRDRSGALPAGERAMTQRLQRLRDKLAETPWPTALHPIEISRAELDAHLMPINATVEGEREMSIAILDVTTRLPELRMSGGDFRGVRYALWGPVVEHDGVVTGAMRPREWSKLEPGTYLIRAKGPGSTTNVRIVLSTNETPTERWMQVGEIAPDAPVEQRRLDAIYPFLGDMHYPYVRQKAFLLAPREAFVYSTEKLRSGSSPEDIFATEDEPLLVGGPGNFGEGVYVINAEGFTLALRDTEGLAAKPAGTPVLPAAIHARETEFATDALKDPNMFESDAAAPIAKKYLASIESWNKCVDKVLQSYGGAAANDYDVITYRGGKIVNVEGLSEKAWKAADRTCHTKKVQAGWETFNKKLSAIQVASRAQRLTEIRKAWAM